MMYEEGYEHWFWTNACMNQLQNKTFNPVGTDCNSFAEIFITCGISEIDDKDLIISSCQNDSLEAQQ